MHLRTRAANPRKFVSSVFRFERTKKCGNFNFIFPFSFKFVGHFNHLVPFQAFWGVFMINTISFRTALLINFSLRTDERAHSSQCVAIFFAQLNSVFLFADCVYQVWLLRVPSYYRYHYLAHVTLVLAHCLSRSLSLSLSLGLPCWTLTLPLKPSVAAKLRLSTEHPKPTLSRSQARSSRSVQKLQTRLRLRLGWRRAARAAFAVLLVDAFASLATRNEMFIKMRFFFVASSKKQNKKVKNLW